MAQKRMKRIIGFWTNEYGLIRLNEGLFLVSLGIPLTPVICIRHE